MSTTTPTPDRKQSAFVASHTDLVLALPEPGREWIGSELDQEPTVGEELIGAFENVVQGLKANNAIHRVRQEHHNQRLLIVWRTDRAAYEQARRRREGEDTLPCGHRAGFKHTVDGYACGFQLCNATYDRETVAEVFG